MGTKHRTKLIAVTSKIPNSRPPGTSVLQQSRTTSQTNFMYHTCYNAKTMLLAVSTPARVSEAQLFLGVFGRCQH